MFDGSPSGIDGGSILLLSELIQRTGADYATLLRPAHGGEVFQSRNESRARRARRG